MWLDWRGVVDFGLKEKFGWSVPKEVGEELGCLALSLEGRLGIGVLTFSGGDSRVAKTDRAAQPFLNFLHSEQPFVHCLDLVHTRKRRRPGGKASVLAGLEANLEQISSASVPEQGACYVVHRPPKEGRRPWRAWLRILESHPSSNSVERLDTLPRSFATRL